MEKRLKPSFVLSSCYSFISLHEYYLVNPNGEDVWNWISNDISKFHKVQRLMKSGSLFYWTIFGFLWEKKRLPCERNFSQLKHNLEIPNGDNARHWVVNPVVKFHDDPTGNESKIVIFMKQIWWAAGKRKSFWGGGEEKRIERMNSRKSYRLI